MDATKNKLFLEQVVVWPGKDNPGWINLHCHLKNDNPSIKGGKDFVIGWPFKTVDDLISRATWVQGTNNFFDCWFCTSQQRDAETNTKTGKLKAKRLASNATWLKAIWIDVDVKAKPASWDAENPGKPWTHYETMEEAWAAVSAFIKLVGLPTPSALVNSGGGWHVYWISDEPLPPDAWRPYAEGLKSLLLREGVKCDTGLTTDNVRILRVPGTLNHKYSPPRVVNLVHLGQVYKFGTALSFLKNSLSDITQVSSPVNTRNMANDPVEPGWTATAPDPAFAALTGGAALQAGIEGGAGVFLVDPTPVFQRCGFLRDALVTGGKDYDNPLWNLSVLCTAFMEDGNAIAHKISKGHATYSAPDTQALYDRKVADRADRGIGYPSCSTIAGAGCKACQTCPLLKNGKSPLNIRPPRVAPVTATVTPTTPQTPEAISLQLPDGYDVDGDGRICEIAITKNKDGSLDESWLPLFLSKIDMPWAQKDPDVIHFRTSYDKGNTIQTSLRIEDVVGPGFEKKLAIAKVKFVSKYKSRLEGFFMAWLDVLHKNAEAQTAQAFGWYRDNGAIKGFAYGGFIHMDDGTSAPAGMTDKMVQSRFTPEGQLAPWHAAADFVFRQQRPELDVVVATSFAAPLLELTGTTGAMLSAWGDSGVGKSFALEIGVAVWGHPKKGKEVTSSTWKSIEHRLGSTVNLPVYWDEITNEEAQHNALKMVMLTSGGVLGARQNQNTTAREKTTWSTLVSINSNLCFKEFIAKEQPNHPAGLNRVLEYRVVKPAVPLGIASTSEADQALSELKHHYGSLGLTYAKVLGQDHVAIQARINKVLANFETTLQPAMEDRFWVGTIAALIVGAEIARDKLGVPFDVTRLSDFLIHVYEENKAGRAAANVSVAAATFAEDFLTAFLKDHNMESVWVDKSPPGPGNYKPVSWRVNNPNSPRPKGLSIRFDQTANTVLVSKRALKTWVDLKMKNTSMTEIMGTLKKNYAATEVKKSINAGTPFVGGQEHCILISAAGDADLTAAVNQQMPDNSALGASVGMSAAAVDTGITPADEEVKTNAVG